LFGWRVFDFSDSALCGPHHTSKRGAVHPSRASALRYVKVSARVRVVSVRKEGSYLQLFRFPPIQRAFRCPAPLLECESRHHVHVFLAEDWRVRIWPQLRT
jgi:hypothetical protein